MTNTKNIHDRINLALSQTLKSAKESPAPPKLAAAIDYAVFPGGARVRPSLCLAVAQACGEDFLEKWDLGVPGSASSLFPAQVLGVHHSVCATRKDAARAPWGPQGGGKPPLGTPRGGKTPPW